MISTISILLFFGLPFFIYGGKVSKYYSGEVKMIDELARNGTEINGILLLKMDGFLGDGGCGFVYEGKIKEDNRPVAIKFVMNLYISECETEMAMYSYLKAYQNVTVEKYGIPSVYYYGRWEFYILMAVTKLDIDLKGVAKKVNSFGKNPLDVLILFRDFVYQSKYLHSHGIRHDDITPRNIMLRGHRSFLIDFNVSSKMKEDQRAGNRKYTSRRINTDENRRAIDDYESFIYTISSLMLKNLFNPEYDDNAIRKNQLGNNGTEKIIKAFADEVFTNDASKEFPDYDRLEKLISDEIKIIHPNGAPTFSWLATDLHQTSPARNITEIDDPKSFNFTRFVYPEIAVRLQ